MREVREYILWLIVLIGALVLVSMITARIRAIGGNANSDISLGTGAARGGVSAPSNFQALVSYTNGGFQPLHLSVHKGDTIRFTNNSDLNLYVRAAGGSTYPPVLDGCSALTALDSCRNLRKGEYWEFKALTPGAWNYENALDAGQLATISVSSGERPAERMQAAGYELPASAAPKPYIDPDVPAPTSAVNGHVTVMHNEGGFDPVNLTVYAGTKVRFHNVDGKMHVMSAGEALYPAAAGGCGKSAFDSCHPVARGEEWELEFTEKGVWTYYNAVATDEKAVIRVI